MKWNYLAPENEPDLAPDLEWMLQSGQVSPALLLQSLLEDHCGDLFQLAVVLTGNRIAARQVLRNALGKVFKRKHRFPGNIEVRTWLHRLVWNEAYRAYRREVAWNWLEKILAMPGEFSHRPDTSPDPFMEAFLNWLDELPIADRFVLLVREQFDWENEHLADILGWDPARVISLNLQIDQKLSYFLHTLDQEKVIDRSRVQAWVNILWPPLIEDEIAALADQLLLELKEHTQRSMGETMMREMVLFLVAAILVSGLIWGGSRLLFPG